MAIALTEEQSELADAVAKFVARNAPTSQTRKEFDSLAAGETPGYWGPLLDMGLHAIHIPGDLGGQDGKIEDLAVVVEEAGRGLLPGPFLPTVIASAVLVDGAGSARDQFVKEFVAGSTGALVSASSHVTATASPGGGWIVSGSSEPVIGLVSAKILVLGVWIGDETRWFALDAGRKGLTCTSISSTDITRDAGILTLESLELGAEDELKGISSDRVQAIQIALLAAEAAGLMRWSLDTSVAYAKIREQFGKPIGSFQAVKHKCARLMVATELAAAAAWDAAVSLDQDEGQQRRAVATAAVMALGPVADALTEAVSLHGGIGFTWEYDIHLYLRRGIAIAAAAGPTSTWRSRLGETALDFSREIRVELPDEDPEFRAQVAALLDQARAIETPEVVRSAHNRDRSSRAGTGERRTFLADHLLVSSHWPKPWGLGANPTQQIILSEEYARRDIPQPSTGIGEWALPTILAHGSQFQQEKFALPTLRGDLVWCQLFSEPGAGSDLAGLTTKAVKVDGGWQLDGQKVWTSGAHEADWGICLARTDPDAPKHRGISYFLVDMHSPGLDIRPLRQSTGQAHFNEVFFDAVFVPDELLVGEPGEGWRLTATTLANERTSIAGSLGSVYEKPLVEVLRSGQYAAARSDVVQTLGWVTARGEAIGALNLRETMRRLNGIDPGAGSSVAKVATAQLARDSVTEAVNLLGPAAIAADSPADLVFIDLGVPEMFIGGGTIEIQLNIIAERILQFPRS